MCHIGERNVNISFDLRWNKIPRVLCLHGLQSSALDPGDNWRCRVRYFNIYALINVTPSSYIA